MTSVPHYGHVRYESIPESPESQEACASSTRAPNKGLVRVLEFFRSRGLIVLLVIVTASVLVTGGARLIERDNYFRASPLRPSQAKELSSIPHQRSRENGKRSRSSILGYFSGALTFNSRFAGVARSDAACSTAEDFSVDEMVQTGLCSPRRLCRARLTVSKEGFLVLVKAGFYIYTGDGKVRTVDSETKQRMQTSTAKRVRKWAVSLLEGVSAQLDELECTVTVDVISEAITEAKDTAVTCPETGDPLCDAMVTVKDCIIPVSPVTGGTKEEKECLEFVESSHGVDTVSELQSGCPNGIYWSSRVGVSLPFCKSACSSDPCAEHIVYMDFYIQTNRRGPNPADCVSASLIPAYQLLHSTLPGCDSAPFGYEDEGSFIVPVVDVYEDTVPKELEDLAESYGCELTYAYFIKSGSTLKEIVDASCVAH
ncbi:hypothetical protein FGB62_191g00 [Gracilaria domingensis]|nr:hypothetical protein FGB62_191g00 [Gracilaria domingensis]